MILFLRTRMHKRLSTRFYKPRLHRIIYVVYVLNYSRLRCNLSIVYVDVFTRPREIMYVDKDRIMYYVKKTTDIYTLKNTESILLRNFLFVFFIGRLVAHNKNTFSWWCIPAASQIRCCGRGLTFSETRNVVSW